MKLYYASNTTTCHEKDILVQGCKCYDLCPRSCSCDVCKIDQASIEIYDII